MKGGVFVATFVVFLVCFCLEICPTNSQEQATAAPTSKEECAKHNGSCEDCVGSVGAKCFYCMTDLKCDLYPAKEIFPTKHCALSQARWGVCFLNFEALIISMSVIAGLLIIGFSMCIYCCCCRSKSNKAKHQREDVQLGQKKAERHAFHDQKKAERKAKNDEIRRKYGLMPDDEGSYHKFEETA